MKAIIGLGNIGKEYENTRHNIGFTVVEELARKHNLTWSNNPKLNCEIAKGDGFILVKPTTFMNLSGIAVRKVMDYFKVWPNKLLVILDDVNFETGYLRLRPTGSHGGQNGLKDIIRHMGNDRIKRLRFGVGIPRENLSHFVLKKFPLQESEAVKKGIEKSINAIEDFIKDKEFEKIMSAYNG